MSLLENQSIHAASITGRYDGSLHAWVCLADATELERGGVDRPQGNLEIASQRAARLFKA
jgi:hypothetical protein